MRGGVHACMHACMFLVAGDLGDCGPSLSPARKPSKVNDNIAGRVRSCAGFGAMRQVIARFLEGSIFILSRECLLRYFLIDTFCLILRYVCCSPNGT